MGISAGPNSISDNLAFHIDPANPRSYAGVGTVIYDLSGNGKTSYFTNGAFYQNYSKGVVVLDGNDDYISTPPFSLTSSITISVWVKNAIRSGRVFGYSTSPDDFLFGILATSVLIRINTVNSGGTFPSANFNTWTNLVLTRDGSSVNKYYRDGIASSVVGGVTGTIIFDQIGRYSNSVGANNIKGSIGEVKVYNRELSASEVLQNYNASKSKYIVVENIVTNGLVLNIDAANSSSYSNPLTYTGTGLTAYDLSGFGNTATLINGTGFTGTNSGAFLFDGTNDYISVSSSPTTFSYNRSSFTVDGWTNMTSLPTSYFGVILSKWNTGGGNDNEFILNTDDGNKFLFAVDFDDSLDPNTQSNDYVLSNTTITANTWYYVTGTFDNGVIKIYVNGSLENSVTSSYTTVKTNTNSSLQIGRFGTIYHSFGRRGNIKLYNRALSATEVMQNFNAMRERYNL